MENNIWSADIHSLTILSIVLRLTLALVIGGVIGLDRENIRKPAGVRTYMLICMGAALAMLTNEFIVQVSYPYGGDLARMGAQVISGIGFLGAGTIIVIGKMKVSGLTTAAGLWASAAVGIACGIGFYSGALIGGLFIYIVMVLLHKVDVIGKYKHKISEICVELEDISKLKGFFFSCEEYGMKLENLTVERVKESAHIYVTFTTYSTSEVEKASMLETLLNTEGVKYVQDL